MVKSKYTYLLLVCVYLLYLIFFRTKLCVCVYITLLRKDLFTVHNNLGRYARLFAWRFLQKLHLSRQFLLLALLQCLPHVGESLHEHLPPRGVQHEKVLLFWGFPTEFFTEHYLPHLILIAQLPSEITQLDFETNLGYTTHASYMIFEHLIRLNTSPMRTNPKRCKNTLEGRFSSLRSLLDSPRR